jgi:two-component system NtrC family sensor kinase
MRWALEEIKDKKLLWDVLDALFLPAFLVDPDLNITGLNGSVREKLSFSKKELVGRPLLDIVRVHPSKKELYSNNFVTADGHCLKKDRESFPARITFVRTPEGFIVVTEAIENTRLIAKLREKMKQIELINEISNVVNSSLSIGHIFRIIASEVKKTLDFDRASITLLNESKNNMNIFTLDTELPTKLVKGTKAPIKGTSAGWVTTNQKPWINRDLMEEIPFERDSILLKEGIRSTISVPLYKDKPLGSLNLDSTLPEMYCEKDLEILIPVARQLSIALENALLFEEISREKREWEKTFDSITDMVWIEDTERRILRTNRAVTHMTALPGTALIGKKSEEVFKSLKIKTESGTQNRPRRYRELTGVNGSIYVHWTYPLVDSEGATYGIVNSLKDATEQKGLEQQLARANKLASLGTLVAGIAHEVNNPLGIIAGYSEALLDRAKEPELAGTPGFEDFPEYLETINREIFRCKDILKSLLDFARPSTGIFREIDINALIKEVILLVKHKAKKENRVIELDLAREIPKTAADPGGLRQLFMNIIMNSFYFMGAEGRIFIKTRSESDPYGASFIRITISDTGRGIDKDLLERIFDPFFTTKPAGDGTGLGLSICHRIVSEHDGTINVKSSPGEGTTFIIRLPLKEISRARN